MSMMSNLVRFSCLFFLVMSLFFAGVFSSEEDIQSYEVSPTLYNYNVTMENKTCLIAEIAAEILVEYNTKDGTETARIALPDPADDLVQMDGLCSRKTDPDHAMLSITWNISNAIVMNFTRDTKTKNVYLSGLQFDYDLADHNLFPNATDIGEMQASRSDVLLTMGSDKKFFQCHSLITPKINDNVSVEYHQMKVQAFNVDGHFSKDASVCAGDKSSTVSPPITPTATPTGTPAPPTPPPTPKKGNWTVKQDNGTVCIVAEMGIRFNIPYKKKGNKNGTAVVDLPTNADNSGSMCGNDSQILELTFFKNWTLDLIFDTESAKTNAVSGKTEYSVHNVSLTYYQDEDLFPDSETDPTVEMTAVANDLDMFRAGVGGSYICQSKTALTLSHNVTMNTYNLHVQAFKYDNDTHFVGNEVECSSDTNTNSVVPIAVGAALAALVAIVLIAYIIGRKRSRTGYESV